MGENTATDVLDPKRVVRDPSDKAPGEGEGGERESGKATSNQQQSYR